MNTVVKLGKKPLTVVLLLTTVFSLTVFVLLGTGHPFLLDYVGYSSAVWDLKLFGVNGNVDSWVPLFIFSTLTKLFPFTVWLPIFITILLTTVAGVYISKNMSMFFLWLTPVIVSLNPWTLTHLLAGQLFLVMAAAITLMFITYLINAMFSPPNIKLFILTASLFLSVILALAPQLFIFAALFWIILTFSSLSKKWLPVPLLVAVSTNMYLFVKVSSPPSSAGFVPSVTVFNGFTAFSGGTFFTSQSIIPSFTLIFVSFSVLGVLFFATVRQLNYRRGLAFTKVWWFGWFLTVSTGVFLWLLLTIPVLSQLWVKLTSFLIFASFRDPSKLSVLIWFGIAIMFIVSYQQATCFTSADFVVKKVNLKFKRVLIGGVLTAVGVLLISVPSTVSAQAGNVPSVWVQAQKIMQSQDGIYPATVLAIPQGVYVSSAATAHVSANPLPAIWPRPVYIGDSDNLGPDRFVAPLAKTVAGLVAAGQISSAATAVGATWVADLTPSGERYADLEVVLESSDLVLYKVKSANNAAVQGWAHYYTENLSGVVGLSDSQLRCDSVCSSTPYGSVLLERQSVGVVSSAYLLTGFVGFSFIIFVILCSLFGVLRVKIRKGK